MALEITGGSREVSVGEEIKLGINFIHSTWGALQSVAWTIPGNIVTNYVDGQGTAVLTKFDPAELQKRDVRFYWVEGGDQDVKADCVFMPPGGKEIKVTLHATFKVQRPTANLTTVTGKVDISNAWGSGLELHYGTPTTPGIEWTGKVKTGSRGKGSIKFVQVIQGYLNYLTDSGETWEYAQPSGRYDLDESNPYAAAVAIGASEEKQMVSSDSPGTGGLPNTRKHYSMFHLFKCWLMFRPDLPNAIWVPLAKVDWYCKGEADKVTIPLVGKPPLVNWVLGSTNNNKNPAGTDTTEFPTWDFISKSGKKWVKK